MHLASLGSGPVILFLHGFPELWYSWRHQLLSLSSLGYQCVAPYLRGYGGSDAPASSASYTVFHIVGDLVSLLDMLGVESVPDRVKALVNLSVAYRPRNPTVKPVEGYRALFGDDYYVCRFQEPGEIEEEFAQLGTEKLIKLFLAARDPGPFLIPKETGLRGMPDPPPLPSWISEQDIDYFVNTFNRTGFTGGLNYYRAMDQNWELTAPWTGSKIKVPVKFVVGDLDITYNIPGIKEYIHGGGFKRDVPFLQEVVVMEGVAHFINQEKSEEISMHIYDFVKKF
ncbi:RING-H2 finger protein ATL5-like [Hibiscus syriacus]|uniref:RING-H2 finger protein ATL5-like n=1 Tax=Hibiscus syriacus TaxID=106335 RepID=A0A6A2Y6D7_HIBSY|nr:RING-H2 finger protein ATL5-like [Hibiscus syriacus]